MVSWSQGTIFWFPHMHPELMGTDQPESWIVWEADISPFGLGVLDLAVGKYVYDQVAHSGQLQLIDGFFHELRHFG